VRPPFRLLAVLVVVAAATSCSTTPKPTPRPSPAPTALVCPRPAPGDAGYVNSDQNLVVNGSFGMPQLAAVPPWGSCGTVGAAGIATGTTTVLRFVAATVAFSCALDISNVSVEVKPQGTP
jgi:hypothetical protein